MTNKSCNFCGNIHFKKDKIQYQYRDGNHMLLVNNVPAEVCNYCGEAFFPADVLKKIESEYGRIKTKQKIAVHCISVPIEEYSDI